MPVYICQAGANSSEPWRHGLQVYEAPFPLTDVPANVSSQGHHVTAPHMVPTASEGNSQGDDESAGLANDPPVRRPRSQTRRANFGRGGHSSDVSSFTEDGNVGEGVQQHIASLRFGKPVRRIRHAEVVLVDDVCIAFDRHWLRLRWPGSKGGFAGYVALGKVNETVFNRQALGVLQLREATNASASGHEGQRIRNIPAYGESAEAGLHQPQTEDRSIVDREEEDDRGEKDEGNEDGNRDDELQENASALSSEPYESVSMSAVCLRTGIEFPSSGYMKLMAMYDDGLSPGVSSSPLPNEPIFCRICREGLHDDADDEQPSPVMEKEADDNKESDGQSETNRRSSSLSQGGSVGENSQTGNYQGPVRPHPVYQANSHATENPLISPCECSGSMAFVHYLCVEQWRCRSRHPKACRGLNCETCGTLYALPPPSTRPVDNEDWLEAMPPHVIEALRQPHIWWQIGAAIVRRRWLRPIAPVVMSPIVALYCRARRLLKKKGVARRRWACSLCRRRARWKCVRCLRSYYCSRQCQNVSWHIVHKHVCYKPTRWYSSLVLYGIATLLAFPGILRDPMFYDLGFSFIPISFYIMAILGGGIATALKKNFSVDLRGRTFELVIMLLTLGLSLISLGLLRAFFGDSSKCYGVFGSLQLSEDDQFYQFLRKVQRAILDPAKNWFLMWDRFVLSYGPRTRNVLCMPRQEDIGCFEYLPKADSGFLFDEENGGKCSMDMILVTSLLQGAAVVAAGNHYWKRRERHRRAARRPRPHHD